MVFSRLHFPLQAVFFCSVRISFYVKMNGTSSKCCVSWAESQDRSVSSHQEDWLGVIFTRWLSEENKIQKSNLEICNFFSPHSLLCNSGRGGQFQSDGTKILGGIALCETVHEHTFIHVHLRRHTYSQKIRYITHSNSSALQRTF